jgi:hypothetical protein
MTLKSIIRSMAAAAALLTLTACASKPTLYEWGSYPSSLYSYLKGSGVDMGAQIIQLEQHLQKTAAVGKNPPPGLHGHLALLYSKTGNDSKAIANLERERQLFPESAAYIDFLLKNAATARAKPQGAE